MRYVIEWYDRDKEKWTYAMTKPTRNTAETYAGDLARDLGERTRVVQKS